MEFLRALLLPAIVSVSLVLSALLLGPASASFALFLNAFLMSQVAGSMQVKAIKLPGSYYRLRRVERSGWIYRRVGILFFKRLMTSRLYRVINPGFGLSPRRQSLPDLVLLMQYAEAAHALLFGFMFLCSAIALYAGSAKAAFWLLLFNVAGNAYPVMLQRYNRARIERLHGRLDSVQ